MQVWDQVKVVGGEYDGMAGLVIGVDSADKRAIVKLDEKPDFQLGFTFDELKFLGR